ncbi:MAG TPA: hypothetical protein VEW69_07390 [Alphaproteobacteria bacterium]|nr:hypothetical protein [Alphaproteobacteria bacterium]
MHPVHDNLRAAARRWIAAGRNPDLLLTGREFFMTKCWMDSSSGADIELQVREFVAASKAALGGEAGWLAMLHEKEFCSGCGMSFHLENLGVCTGCGQYVCGGCKAGHAGCPGEVVG